MKAIPSDLAGRTALVTGAGKTLGRAICLALAGAGVNIAAHYNTSEEETLRLSEEIHSFAQVKVWPVPADLADPGKTQGFFRRVREVAGPVDILINGASIFPSDTLQDATLESIAANQQINALAPLVLSREFAAQGRTGHILNMLDTRAFDHDPKHFAYHLSKRTLFTLTRIMAMEFAPKIQVNAVAPGLVLPPAGQDESYLAKSCAYQPAAAVRHAEEIAEAVVFLLRSNFITGQVIYVDGGRHLKGAFYGGV